MPFMQVKSSYLKFNPSNIPAIGAPYMALNLKPQKAPASTYVTPSKVSIVLLR